jgi:AcrR family transcriptional regulator
MIPSDVRTEVSPRASTKERILDAAEVLFAKHGFDATSLRLITSAAGVNLAAVNYHFHSKQTLIEAVVVRRVAPVNKERLDMLARAEANAGEGALLLEEVVRAFVAPVVMLRLGAAGARIAPLFARIHMEPCDSARLTFYSQMRQVLRPFTEAFQRCLPGLPMAELLWRVHFGVGVMAHALVGWENLKSIAGAIGDAPAAPAVIDRIVTFVCAGMRAPLPGAPNRS